MKTNRNVTDTVVMIGAGDRRLEKFENIFPIPNGVSYNSYLIIDKKTAVLDTIDSALSEVFFENIEAELKGRAVDYLVVHHMEPDHCYNIKRLAVLYPEMQIVCSAKAATMIEQFFGKAFTDRILKVCDKDELDLGEHKLTFMSAPMVHWPEVLYSYDEKDKILFSADAFGTFGALEGNLFISEIDLNDEILSEYRRYYSNICGRFGLQVTNSLKKVSDLEIRYICPLHGYVIDDKMDVLLEKYAKWGAYEPEDNSVLIIYGSMYGNTENAVNILANLLGEKGVRGIKVYDASVTNFSYLVAEVFRCKHIVFASPTYNNSIYIPMRVLIDDLKHLNFQKRNVSFIENGTWSYGAAKMMADSLATCKCINIIGDPVRISSAVNEESYSALERLADSISEENRLSE